MAQSNREIGQASGGGGDHFLKLFPRWRQPFNRLASFRHQMAGRGACEGTVTDGTFEDTLDEEEPFIPGRISVPGRAFLKPLFDIRRANVQSWPIDVSRPSS